MRHHLAIRPAISLLVWLLIAAGALLPVLALAQSHTLSVSLHDAGGLPLHGIVIVIRDERGQELGRQTTDMAGPASFTDLPAVVRVAVEGQARVGQRLYQLGDDERGVRFDLGQAQGSPRLDLRVERDGLVLPDPATMLSLEEGGPVVEEGIPLPTAVIATPAPLPTATADTGTGIAAIGESSSPVERRPYGWVPLVTVLVIAVAAGVMRLLQRRRDAR